MILYCIIRINFYYKQYLHNTISNIITVQTQNLLTNPINQILIMVLHAYQHGNRHRILVRDTRSGR